MFIKCNYARCSKTRNAYGWWVVSGFIQTDDEEYIQEVRTDIKPRSKKQMCEMLIESAKRKGY